MNEKRRALGRGLGALIPGPPTVHAGTRPVDVFFDERPDEVGDAARKPSNASSWSPHQPFHETPDDAAATDAWSPTGSEGQVDLVPVTGARFEQVPVHSIRPNPRQPRTVFDEDEMAELTQSIAEIGVLQPVVVREIDQSQDPSEAQYELVMGERRWRATIQAGLDTVPAIVRETADDMLLRDALLENLHRSQLNPLEEAAAYQQLLDDFGGTHDELATRLGRSRPQISNTIRLLRLPPLVARRVAAGVLSAGHARALLGLSDGAAIERLAQRVVAEGLSVRAVEELVTLGDSPAATRRARPRAEDDTALLDLAATLSDRLDTRVRIAMGQRKGRLSVEFASVEDLHRILDLLVADEKATDRVPGSAHAAADPAMI